MPLDIPPMEQVDLQRDEEARVENTVAVSLAALKKEILAGESTEKLQDEVRVGKKIEQLSSHGGDTYELYLGAKRVGSIVKCEAQQGWTPKAMFASAERSPLWFDKDAQGNTFPNIKKIEQYFLDKAKETGKQIQITMISTGPTFSSYGSTKLAGVNYDNGVAVGTEKTIDGSTTDGKGIISIAGGKIQISHTQEMDQVVLDELIAKQADIMTMSSMKRNGNINSKGTLRKHPYGHSLVQFNNGTRGEVILNNATPEEKQKVMTDLDVSRAVYADADAKSNFLDGIWIQTPTGLKYSHPDEGDLFMNEQVPPGNVVKDNMPGVIIYYAQEQ